jgi:hypothetical protein
MYGPTETRDVRFHAIRHSGERHALNYPPLPHILQVVVMFFSTVTFLLMAVVLAGLVSRLQSQQYSSLSKHQLLLLLDLDKSTSEQASAVRMRSVALKARVAMDQRRFQVCMCI